MSQSLDMSKSLTCEWCGNPYASITSVTFYSCLGNRSEKLVIKHGGRSQKRHIIPNEHNPGDDNAVRIKYVCESCEKISVMDLVYHKGLTAIETLKNGTKL